MLERGPRPTLDELRAQMARKEAELAQKRAARLQAAMLASAKLAEQHTRRRVMMEMELADAIAKVATTAAMCEMRTESVVGARRA